MQSRSDCPRVLWLVSVTLPAAARALGLTGAIGGGWVEGQLRALTATGGVRITVCTVNPAVKTARTAEADGVRYAVLPRGSREEFAVLLAAEQPDLVHLWGSEYPPAAELFALCDPARTLLSVQGLMGPCAEHLLDGVPEEYRGSCFGQRLIDRVVPGGLLDRQRAYFEAGAAREAALLAGLRHVSGRTEWDRAELAQLAPDAVYWRCNETLRPEFTTGCWQPRAARGAAAGEDGAAPAAAPAVAQASAAAPRAACAPGPAAASQAALAAVAGLRAGHSAAPRQAAAGGPVLFLSQGNLSLKGLHRLIEALPAICAEHPGARLVVAGWPPLDKGPLLRPVIRWMFPYQRYCADLAARLGVAERIHYTGPLDAAGMKRQLLAADVFLLTSSIENSPNSLGEAMLLGMPCVASRVGGVPSLLTDGKEGLLYPAGDPAALAGAVLALLADPARAAALGAAARARARVTHDPARNAGAMLGIYRGILSGEGPAGAEANNAETDADAAAQPGANSTPNADAAADAAAPAGADRAPGPAEGGRG